MSVAAYGVPISDGPTIDASNIGHRIVIPQRVFEKVWKLARLRGAYDRVRESRQLCGRQCISLGLNTDVLDSRAHIYIQHSSLCKSRTVCQASCCKVAQLVHQQASFVSYLFLHIDIDLISNNLL